MNGCSDVCKLALCDTLHWPLIPSLFIITLLSLLWLTSTWIHAFCFRMGRDGHHPHPVSERLSRHCRTVATKHITIQSQSSHARAEDAQPGPFSATNRHQSVFAHFYGPICRAAEYQGWSTSRLDPPPSCPRLGGGFGRAVAAALALGRVIGVTRLAPVPGLPAP